MAVSLKLYDVISEIRLCQSMRIYMHIYVRNNSAKFHLDPI